MERACLYLQPGMWWWLRLLKMAGGTFCLPQSFLNVTSGTREAPERPEAGGKADPSRRLSGSSAPRLHGSLLFFESLVVCRRRRKSKVQVGTVKTIGNSADPGFQSRLLTPSLKDTTQASASSRHVTEAEFSQVRQLKKKKQSILPYKFKDITRVMSHF